MSKGGKACVLGAGAWGTALAKVLAEKNDEVVIWGRNQEVATQIKDNAGLTVEVKAKLTREIIEHEISHGLCTQTFLKKMRKHVRPAL